MDFSDEQQAQAIAEAERLIRPETPEVKVPQPTASEAPKRRGRRSASAISDDDKKRARELAVKALSTINSTLGLVPPVAQYQQLVTMATEGKASLLLTQQEIAMEADALVEVPEIRAWLLEAPAPWINLLMVNVYIATSRAALIQSIRIQMRQVEQQRSQQVPVDYGNARGN